MKLIMDWLDATKDHLENDFDLIVPVIGDEGTGKSTLMTAMGWLWLDVLEGREQTIENQQAQIAWDTAMFKEYLGTKDQYSCIIVHDAARVLNRKKAMHGDQIELEEDIFDARFGNYLVLLGFQQFSSVPTTLAERRAENALYVPDRGIVHGFNDAKVREKHETGDWPDPTLRDTFPDLAGTDVWEAFEAEDQRRKKERIKPDEDDEEDDMGPRELAEHIVEENMLGEVTSIHGGHNKVYIDPDLIEIELGVSGQKAKKAGKVLKKWRSQGEITLGGEPI